MTSKQWQDQYRYEKPAQNDPLIMQCRTNRRAAWAAQLAQDSGLQNCFVYRQARFCLQALHFLGSKNPNHQIMVDQACQHDVLTPASGHQQ